VFDSFVISRIEEGQRLYGVGTQRQMCLLIDRGGSVRRNGVPKVEVRDMAMLPRVAVLVNTIVNTVQVSELLSGRSSFVESVHKLLPAVDHTAAHAKSAQKMHHICAHLTVHMQLNWLRRTTRSCCTRRRSRRPRGSSRSATA
jgi:hypothetical protein